MKVTLTPTNQITFHNGAPVRVWHGVTEQGARCLVFVAGISVPDTEDAAEFDRELKEVGPSQEISEALVLLEFYQSQRN